MCEKRWKEACRMFSAREGVCGVGVPFIAGQGQEEKAKIKM
jgi:hypothetical protein